MHHGLGGLAPGVTAAVVVLAGATIVDAQTLTARIHALGRPSSAAEVLQVSPQTVTRDWRLMKPGSPASCALMSRHPRDIVGVVWKRGAKTTASAKRTRTA